MNYPGELQVNRIDTEPSAWNRSIGTRDRQLSNGSSPNRAIMVADAMDMAVDMEPFPLGGDADIAQFGVELQRMHAAFAPDARQLRSAEGCAQIAQEP